MISFDGIIGVLLGDVRRGRDQFVDHPQVRAGLVGGHLDRRRAIPQRLWVPRTRAALRDLRVFVEQPAEAVMSVDS
jgi:hypothetical protein